MTDTRGIEVENPFYITEQDGFLLLDNEVLQMSYQCVPQRFQIRPSGVRNHFHVQLFLELHHDATRNLDPGAVQTYLLVVVTYFFHFSSFSTPKKLRTLEKVKANTLPQSRTVEKLQRDLIRSCMVTHVSTEVVWFTYVREEEC